MIPVVGGRWQVSSGISQVPSKWLETMVIKVLEKGLSRKERIEMIQIANA